MILSTVQQVPGMGIESVGKALTSFGYSKQEYYAFPKKKLLATWYAPPSSMYETLPRVFVSELQVSGKQDFGTYHNNHSKLRCLTGSEEPCVVARAAMCPDNTLLWTVGLCVIPSS